jgi:hypothetical protein
MKLEYCLSQETRQTDHVNCCHPIVMSYGRLLKFVGCDVRNVEILMGVRTWTQDFRLVQKKYMVEVVVG